MLSRFICVQLFVTQQTVPHQAPLSVGFSIQKYWSGFKNTGVGCHFLLQGIFPTQGLNSCLSHLLHWQSGSLPLAPPGCGRYLGAVLSAQNMAAGGKWCHMALRLAGWRGWGWHSGRPSSGLSQARALRGSVPGSAVARHSTPGLGIRQALPPNNPLRGALLPPWVWSLTRCRVLPSGHSLPFFWTIRAVWGSMHAWADLVTAGFGGRQRSPGEAERRRQEVSPCLSNSPGSDLPVMLDVRTDEPCRYHTASVRLYGSYYSYRTNEKISLPYVIWRTLYIWNRILATVS